MMRLPPRSTRTDTRVPYTPLLRSIRRVARVDAIAVARLLAQADAAIAALVEDMKAHQPAEIEASIRLRYAAIGELAHPHGAMFVPCLHRRGPAQQADLGRRAARIQIARPVVPARSEARRVGTERVS